MWKCQRCGIKNHAILFKYEPYCWDLIGYWVKQPRIICPTCYKELTLNTYEFGPKKKRPKFDFFMTNIM